MRGQRLAECHLEAPWTWCAGGTSAGLSEVFRTDDLRPFSKVVGVQAKNIGGKKGENAIFVAECYLQANRCQLNDDLSPQMGEDVEDAIARGRI